MKGVVITNVVITAVGHRVCPGSQARTHQFACGAYEPASPTAEYTGCKCTVNMLAVSSPDRGDAADRPRRRRAGRQGRDPRLMNDAAAEEVTSVKPCSAVRARLNWCRQARKGSRAVGRPCRRPGRYAGGRIVAGRGPANGRRREREGREREGGRASLSRHT
jgi:hypothetical protein